MSAVAHTHSQSTVVAGPASDEDQSSTSPDLGDVFLDPTEDDFTKVLSHTPTHRIHDGLRLFEYLLLHEAGITSFHDLLKLYLESVDLARGWDVGLALLDMVDGQSCTHRCTVLMSVHGEYTCTYVGTVHEVKK